MITTESKRGRLSLMIAHCAGMVDLVALPLWVNALMTYYKMSPQQAGGMVTLFLLGAVASSVLTARIFDRVNTSWVAALGYAVSALTFVWLSNANGFAMMAALHTLGGIAAGFGLSVTHGTIGRSANPHRTFALVNVALSVFVILFYGATPKLITAHGGSVKSQYCCKFSSTDRALFL